MQKYQDVILDAAGNVVPNATIQVQFYPGGGAPVIYSDNGVTVATNPLTSDSKGRFSFYAADGRYQLVVTGAAIGTNTVLDVLLQDMPPAVTIGVGGYALNSIASINGGQLAGLRNRIINGDMRIDQRNNGASLTVGTGGAYALDRWACNASAASKFSAQRNAGGITPPPGFAYYLGITSLSAYAPVGNESFDVEQVIEGYNAADLQWGTAGAVATRLTFWAYSSLTGTFGGSIATTKGSIWVMPFTYSIPVANTWTLITVNITPPTATSGPNTDSLAGVYVRFNLGCVGSFAGGVAGVWTNAGNYIAAPGTVSLVSTNGATLYLTGVDFKRGATVEPFEQRPYGMELALCQRYYQTLSDILLGMYSPSAQTYYADFILPTVMRASPTAAVVGSVTYTNANSYVINSAGTSRLRLSANVSAAGYGFAYGATLTLNAEL